MLWVSHGPVMDYDVSWVGVLVGRWPKVRSYVCQTECLLHDAVRAILLYPWEKGVFLNAPPPHFRQVLNPSPFFQKILYVQCYFTISYTLGPPHLSFQVSPHPFNESC